MASHSDCMTIIAGMTSGAESSRKLAAYHLQSLVVDASFADAFAQADGMPVLRTAALEENGNALAYALGSFTKLLEMGVGWDSVDQNIIERAVQLVTSRPSINVLRNALLLLVLIVSRPFNQARSSRPPTPSSAQSFGLGAVMPVLQEHDTFLVCLVDKLGSADHALVANALNLINALTRDSIINTPEGEWPKIVVRLRELGDTSAVENLMRGGALSDLAGPLLEYQSLTKVLLARWRGVRVDTGNPEHRQALMALHVSSFRPDHPKSGSSHSNRSQLNGTEADRAPDKWRRLGFQSEKPTREFEGAGFLGLIDITEYVQRHLETFQDTLLEQSVVPPEQRCPLARASLSVTMLLYEYFDVESITNEDVGSRIPTNVDEGSLERHIEPLLLRWESLHCACLSTFLKLWKGAGAVVKDYNKIEDLTRLLISNVLSKANRKSTISIVEQELLSVSLNEVREWQLAELEDAYSYAWGVDYQQLRERVQGDALQFLKEQRTRCLLKGAWFPILSPAPRHPQAPPDVPQLTVTAWRFVRLSHDRNYLHYASYPQNHEKDIPVRELPQRIDLDTISSVDSSVSRSSFPNVNIQVPKPTENTTNGHTSWGTITSLTIYGSASSTTAEEKVLLELNTLSSSLGSEWLDGLLMLLDQQPITADTNKLLELLESWTLKVRMFNLRWEDIDWRQAHTGEQKPLPSRPTDRDYWYEMGD